MSRRKDYPSDMVWYEPAENIGMHLLKDFETRVADEAAAREEDELEELEEAEAMPPQ